MTDRTPQSVALDLITNTARHLTANEAAFLAAYHRIINRTNRSKQAAIDMFGRTSTTTLAVAFRAIDEEKIDLARALAAFDDAASHAGLADVARRLGLI